MNKKQIREFISAMDSIVAEKGIDKSVVVEAMEQAMAAAYKKKGGPARCVVNPDTGEIKLFSVKTVVDDENFYDERSQIPLSEAQKQVDDGVQVGRELVVLCRSNVGGEHDVMLLYAANIAELQLGQAGAVTAKAFLMQNLDETRVRRCLNSEVFLVARIPRKCFLYLAGVLTDRLLIVNVERSRIGLGDLLHLLERQKGFLFHWCVRLSFTGVFNRYSYREFAQIDGAYRFPCAGSRFHRYQRYGRP